MANDIPPPPPPAPSVPKAAYVEEYNEEAETENPATRRTANISTKRSKPDVAKARAPHDGVSDSGHSSHTGGTLGSSATSLESKAGSNPPRIETNTAASKRRPTRVENIVKSRAHSPEKAAIRRTLSKSKRDGHPQSKQPCNCSECVARARRSSAAHEQPSKQQESRPKITSRPTLAGLLRSTRPPPAQVVPNVPVLQSVQSRPGASTGQAYNQAARPASFHAGAIAPEPVFVQQPLIIERQPSYPAPSPFPPPSYPPPQSYFSRPLQPQPAPQEFYTTTPSPYPIQPRPRPRQWTSEHPPAPRPQSMYYGSSPPIIEYGEKPIYTTIAPGVRPTPPQRRETAPLSPEEFSLRPEDYYKMPPPPPPKIKTQAQPQQRPPMIRHAHTTSDAHPQLRRRRSGHQESTKAHVSNRSPVKPSYSDHERSKRSEAKPSKKSDNLIPKIHALERGMGHMNIESEPAKNKRRASVYGHESLHDLERSVETYQAAVRGTPTTSNTHPIESLMRKNKTSSDTSSRLSGKSGKSGKSKTSKEGSEVKSRRPSSEVKTRNENDGLAMRFNASQGVNLDLKGGIEGRTISLRQSKDGGEGAMELSIGSRGRTVGTRPPVAGREKSRRRYSYVDGQSGGVTEVERPKTLNRQHPRGYSYLDAPSGGVTQIERPTPVSRPSLRGYSYIDDKGVTTELERVRTGGSTSSAAAMERVRSRADSIQEEREPGPRIIRERIVTTSRSRRSSRSGYGGREMGD